MYLIKRFAEWFNVKTELDKLIKFPRFQEGQVWWCYLGENIGHEENGKGSEFLRPVLIVKKFNNRIFYGIPTSTKIKETKYYYPIHIKGRQISLLMSQMRLIDAGRLLYKQSTIYTHELIQIKNYFLDLFLEKK
jgi:hypothetical protein